MPQKLWKAISGTVSAIEPTYEKLICYFQTKGSEIIHSFHRYHVPRAWLKSNGNTLVLFEEILGDPTQISFATRQIESLCSHISESHPPPVDMWSSTSESKSQLGMPVLSLKCPSPNQVISSIKFASFGTPHGSCGSFSHGKCSSAKALSLVQKVLYYCSLFQ